MDFDELREKFPILAPSATFPKGLEEADLKDSPIFKLVNFLTKSLRPDGSPKAGLVIGHFGTGKTSEVKMSVAMTGYDALYIHAPTTSIEKFAIMIPKWSDKPGEEQDTSKITLMEILDDRLMSDQKFVIIIDEPYLAPPAMKSMLMEILQEGSINGNRIPGMIAAVAMSNPPGGVYGRNAGFDPAAADRFYTIDQTQPGYSSKLWKYAIASDPRLGINERDLTDFYAVYERLDSASVALLPPRLVHFALLALLSGLPAAGSLPTKDGRLIEIVNAKGDTITEKLFADMADALGVANVTRLGDDPLRKIVRASLIVGENPEFVGPHGIGKTAKLSRLVREEMAALFPNREYNFIKFSAPTTVPENNNIPVPIDGKLHNILAERWATDQEVVVFADEFWRASWSTMTQFMEVMQERSLGGHPVNIRSFVGVNNPKEFAGMRYDVGNPSMPMMTRFWYHYDVGLTDSAWPEYLLATYGQTESGRLVTEQVIEWWQDDLTDADRVRMSSRTCERLIDAAMSDDGVPLEWAKSYLDGEYVPVSLSDLETRFANQPLARLTAIAKKVDYYESALAAPGQEHLDDHHAVALAFQRAELSQLKDQRDLCVRLFRVLGVDHQTNMIRQGGERQVFWASVLRDGAKLPKPAKAS